MTKYSISWNPIMPSQTYSIKDALGNYESITTHFWHYQAKAFLHLPCMLQSPSSSEFDCNHTACISGSREVVRVYIIAAVLHIMTLRKERRFSNE
jgi:hypothetical protein